jgi:hypothetical protein
MPEHVVEEVSALNMDFHFLIVPRGRLVYTLGCTMFWFAGRGVSRC